MTRIMMVIDDEIILVVVVVVVDVPTNLSSNKYPKQCAMRRDA